MDLSAGSQPLDVHQLVFSVTCFFLGLDDIRRCLFGIVILSHLNMQLASGKLTVCYWKWPFIYSWFTNEKMWFSIVTLVYQRVCLAIYVWKSHYCIQKIDARRGQVLSSRPGSDLVGSSKSTIKTGVPSHNGYNTPFSQSHVSPGVVNHGENERLTGVFPK